MTDAPPPTPAPEGTGVSRQTIVLLTAIGGGFLALSLFLLAALPSGGPLVAVTTIGFAGSVALFVGAILGAMSDRFSSGARAGYGVGAVLAFFAILFVVIAGPAAATSSPPVCGVAAAFPGMFALRSFAMLRDAGF